MPKVLDVRGERCPMPILKAKKAMDLLPSGEVLEVHATDPGSVADFQGWVRGYRRAALREQRTERDEQQRAVYVHVLEKIG